MLAHRILQLVAVFLLALPAVALADLDLPVAGVVTSGVGWRMDPFGTGKMVFHRGIDIAVPAGTPVHATRKGRVVLAGDDHRGHGNTVIIEHDNGDRTLYGHNSSILVRTGEVVESGTVIALAGSTGRSTGPHVHFEKLPSGRPYAPEALEIAETSFRKDVETAAVRPAKNLSEATALQPPKNPAERQKLEKRMDDSIDSILGLINASRVTGQGG